MSASTAVAPKKRTNPDRDRIELRADSDWINEVTAAADSMGLSISAFIRLAVNQLMRDPKFARLPDDAPPASRRKN